MNKNNNNQINSKLMPFLLSLLYVASCVFIPLIVSVDMGEWLASAISLTMGILSLVAFSKVAKGFKYVFTYALILGATLFMGGGFIIMGVLASIVSAVCLFSYLCSIIPFYIPLALPAVAYIFSLAITRDPISAAIVLFTLPAAMLCVYAVKKKKPRVSAITHISIGFCISLALVIVVAIYRFYGKIDLEACAAFVDAAKNAFSLAINEAMQLLGNSANEMLGVNIDLEVFAENIVTVTFNVLPAIVAIFFNALAYLIHSLTLTLIFNDEKKRAEVLPILRFEMSIHSAFIFIIALILSFALVSDGTALYGTAAENISIILMPGFIITALAALRMFIAKRSPSCFGTLLYFFAIFMIASFSYPVLIAAAIAGAVVRIVIFFKEVSKNKKA